MTVEFFDNDLISRLPIVRGRITENAPMAKQSWFRVGGVAEVLFKPADADDLKDFLMGCPNDIPITVIGVASNLIIRDGGIPGVTIKLAKGFNQIEFDPEHQQIYAGAAALDAMVATESARNGITGLEFFSGIPGTIGGAIRMNAGAYGSETCDVLVHADALDRAGQIHHLTPREMQMGYRHNAASRDLIFVGGLFKSFGTDTPEKIQERIDHIKSARAESQPIREKTGGSTFANPGVDDPRIEQSAWQLVDAAGCRGLMVGGAQMSEKHCNFMINTGEATAADLERLGETVRKRVFENSGVKLRWEIRRLGQPLAKDLDLISTPDLLESA